MAREIEMDMSTKDGEYMDKADYALFNVVQQWTYRPDCDPELRKELRLMQKRLADIAWHLRRGEYPTK